MHHIISDGWSMGLLVKELFTFYFKNVNGDTDPLPPLRVQYKDYAAWQQKQLNDTGIGEHRKYWLEQLKADLPVLELLPDRPRPAVKTYNGGVAGISLNSTHAKQLKAMAQQHGATLFMELTAIVNTLLFLYTRQQDIILGSPIAGREHSDLEGQIGLYVNTLVLRTRFNATESYHELLQTVKKTTLEAYEHQVYPFDTLLDDLGLKRDMSRTPLFDVMIVLHNTHMDNSDPKQISALKMSTYEQGQGRVSKFDLTFGFIETEEKIAVAIEYNSDLFDLKTIERMLGHLQSIVESVISDPGKPIQDIELATEKEKHQLLVEFNSTRSDYPTDKTIIDLLEEQVMRTPDKIALITSEKSITYIEINEQANRLADYLRQTHSIRPNELIAVSLERNEWMLIAILGILKSGAAYVPLDPAYPADRVAHIMEDSKCRLLLDKNELEKFMKDKNKYEADNPFPVNKPADLAYVIYTSGSTGKPKGVMLEHKNTVALFHNLPTKFGFNTVRAFGAATNCTFDISVLELLGTLTCGLTIYLINTPDAEELLTLVREGKIDGLQLTPSRLNLLLEVDPALTALQKLKVLLVGGEALSDAQYQAMKKLTAVKVLNGYGPTETTIYSTTLEVVGSNKVSIGKPLLNQKIFITDDHQHIIPVGVPGEICIAGSGLARGYLNNPVLTAEKFIYSSLANERIYKTGDIGRWLPDGNIEYIGRKDHQVKIRGYRIELGEIENVLQSHPALSAAAVLVKQDSAGEKMLVAYVVSERELSITDIKRFLGTKVPEYMIPAHYVVLEKIPLNASGKIDRKALSALDNSVEKAHVEYVAPVTPIEKELSQIWSEILTIEKAGIKDDFFELGGHSLKTTRLLSRIHKTFGVRLELKHLFKNPTLEQQAELIIESGKPMPASDMPEPLLINLNKERKDIKVAIYFIPPLLGDARIYKEMADAFKDLNVNCYGLQYPGLEGGALLDSMEDYAEALCKEIREKVKGEDIFLFGYSMGGFVAYEMAKRLESKANSLHLYIVDEGIEGDSNRMDIADNFDELFIDLKRHFEMDDSNDEFLTRFLLNNINVFNKYRQQQHKLNCDIVGFQSLENTNPTNMKDWEEYTSASLDLRFINGSHWYAINRKNFNVFKGSLKERIEKIISFRYAAEAKM
jgi:amino acid adenylation domain-containing protein